MFSQDCHATVVRHSYKCRAMSHDSVAKCFGEKICIKFLNMFKTFATSW